MNLSYFTKAFAFVEDSLFGEIRNPIHTDKTLHWSCWRPNIFVSALHRLQSKLNGGAKVKVKVKAKKKANLKVKRKTTTTFLGPK